MTGGRVSDAFTDYFFLSSFLSTGGSVPSPPWTPLVLMAHLVISMRTRSAPVSSTTLLSFNAQMVPIPHRQTVAQLLSSLFLLVLRTDEHEVENRDHGDDQYD